MTRTTRSIQVAAALFAVAVGLAAAPPAAAQSAHTIYTRALARERHLRDAENRATLAQLRKAVQSYENVVRRYPRSGYSDNALWQAANLAVLAFDRFSQAADQRTAARLFNHLAREYPSSSLAPRARGAIQSLAHPRAAASVPRADAKPAPPAPPAAAAPGDDTRNVPSADPPGVVTISDIRRSPLPDGVRVSIEMDGESLFRTERLDNPKRVFFDLRNAQTVPALQDATLRFDEEEVVKEIRIGRHPKNTTRVVMDLESVETYSVFTLYNPYRVVVDFRRAAAPVPQGPAIAPGISPPLSGTAPVNPAKPAATSGGSELFAAKEPVPALSRSSAPALVTPAVPTANSNGQFSLARQLGLGVARIVLDAGHGGHDPGARANGITEAELVLDITLRLRALLAKQPGIEVTLTRATNTFVPLEERTAIANRRGADLFLSIHANASRNSNARGIETYFLNFASNPEAEAVAARENSASGRTMRSLPDIVRAIALNNKIDESRDFAGMVQRSMVRRLRARNSKVRDLGVKQAPFVVLIGAGMPSVLAEISFVTNKQEGALLKTGAYRQQIAESLLDAILAYQRSLKGVRAVAARE